MAVAATDKYVSDFCLPRRILRDGKCRRGDESFHSFAYITVTVESFRSDARLLRAIVQLPFAMIPFVYELFRRGHFFFFFFTYVFLRSLGSAKKQSTK